MDFEEVLACLQDTEKRQEFVARLKNAGENSKPFFNLRDVMIDLKMNQAPRGIFQKTIIQHTLRFSEVKECFQSFRLVCKSWKDAVEKIRFNRMVNYFHTSVYQNIQSHQIPYNSKYLQAFKKVLFPLSLVDGDIGNQVGSLVLPVSSMKKLNEILLIKTCDLTQQHESFIAQLLQNSQDTLQILATPTLNFMHFFPLHPEITFFKLRILDLTIGKDCILAQEFKNYFPQILEKMENLETVKVRLRSAKSSSCFDDVCKYIGENYAKHCISAGIAKMDVMPTKILKGQWHLKNLENKKYSHQLQYLQIDVTPAAALMDNGWDRYKEILDQCTHLKAIELSCGDDVLVDILPTLSCDAQEIWKERISYFKARGIRLANIHEINKNENLQMELAKKAGITWRFEIH